MRALVLLAAAGCWTGGGTTVTEPTADHGLAALEHLVNQIANVRAWVHE